MQALTLQPWTTISSAGATLTQDAAEWLDLAAFADVAFWIDVSQVTLPAGGGALQIAFQTAPSQDETYFEPLAPPVILSAIAPTPAPLVVTSVLTPTTVPVARWVRWQITSTAMPGTWSATVRIRAVPYRQSFFVPTQVPGCALWLRADLGVTGTTSVTGWADQSLSGDANKNLSFKSGVGATTAPMLTTPSDTNKQPAVQFTASSLTVLSSGAWATPLVAPATWIVVAKNTSAGATKQYLFDGFDANPGQTLTFTPSSSPTSVLTIQAGVTTLQWSTGLTTAGVWPSAEVVTGEWNGSNLPNQSQILYGPTGSPKASGAGPSGSQTSMTLGSQNQSTVGATGYWDGYVAEIIAYSGIPSPTDMDRLTIYLVSRYQVAL